MAPIPSGTGKSPCGWDRGPSQRGHAPADPRPANVDQSGLKFCRTIFTTFGITWRQGVHHGRDVVPAQARPGLPKLHGSDRARPLQTRPRPSSSRTGPAPLADSFNTNGTSGIRRNRMHPRPVPCVFSTIPVLPQDNRHHDNHQPVQPGMAANRPNTAEITPPRMPRKAPKVTSSTNTRSRATKQPLQERFVHVSSVDGLLVCPFSLLTGVGRPGTWGSGRPVRTKANKAETVMQSPNGLTIHAPIMQYS